MAETDDPVTVAIVAGAGVAGAAASGAFSKGDKPKMPSANAGNPKRTAQATEQLSDQDKKNRALAASLVTKNWSPPTLGKPGLLGE